ncbi:MAG: Peptidyl-tRNA hydrolase [Candidatus Woesebacteria bacterium GW2011_GWB1_39_10]|uniref:Peptidyl-tRNA hydrolase n=2 Tax=Candidatus Woeseibacteriota TaxID=1752722 RepID=A0A0G0XWK1_9BACT|nr:MAG: Peptidyl-tRNA hydrolase [Candidatus Woesebacteria bacterium GW2011_GWB1_39_10]KKR92272.1 MAG: Peptidyl-tRNA hydrolase [Candidatus Woesebacteria bacterium GW2011_GWA1_41_13b]
MKLVIGLGNPGAEYINTRHNVGFMVADAFNTKIRSTKSEFRNKSQIQIFKSQNFMNESGSFVKDITIRYSLLPINLYIVHDDLDIKLGEYKIQLGHGPKDHNGIKSIDEALGTDQYWHVKIGVDNRPLDDKPMGIEYVLQNFTDEERVILDRVIREVASKLDNI